MATIAEHRTYKIVNVKSGTVLDLSDTDGYPISGWKDNGGANQKWRLGKLGDQWTFRNLLNGRFLGLSSDTLQCGTRLQGVTEEYGHGWNIFRDNKDNDVFRILVPDHNLNIDLASDRGDNADGTTVHLCHQLDTSQQTWRLERAY